MDEIVRRAIAKWPDVPAVFGWLSLDRRGRWRIKGEAVTNATVASFIGRNYSCDAQGRWFFQNGPQRVYVTLAYTPLVYRLVAEAEVLLTHTGAQAAELQGAWLDEAGSVLLLSELGIGLLHDQDLHALVPRLSGPGGRALEEDALRAVLEGRDATANPLELRLGPRRVQVRSIESGSVARAFGFDPSPRPAPGEPEC